MKIRIVYFIIPLIIGLIASFTGFSLVWRLFFLSLLLPVASYLWTFSILRNIGVEIGALPSNIQAGETIENRMALVNPGKIPRLMLHVEEISDVPGYQNDSIVNLFSNRHLEVSSTVLFPRRGQYQLGAYQLSAGDPLGLFKTSRTLGTLQDITVYPKTVELPFFDPLHYLSPGFGPGRWASPQTSSNVASIRDYVSGDSLKHVHWRTTAHSSKIMVKVYDPDRSQNSAKNIWIVNDMDAHVQAGLGIESTQEYSITIAASLIKKYIDQGWPLGYIAQAKDAFHFSIETGIRHRDAIFASLANIQANGQTSIEQLLNNESGHFDLNTLTIVITPSWNERLIRTLLQIKRQQGILVAILLDSGTFGEKTGMSNIPTSLQANGIQVYVVKNGDNLGLSLDSRKL